MPTFLRVLGRGSLLLLSFSLIGPVNAQTSRWQVSVWQRMISQQKRRFMRLGTNRNRKIFVELSRTSVQFRAVLHLEKAGASSDGLTHWNGTLKQLQFSANEEEPPSGWSADIQRKIQANKAADLVGTQRVLAHLAAASLKVVQGGEGQIVSVDTSGLVQKMKTALQTVSDKRRSNVAASLQPTLDANQWKIWLSAQSPTSPASHKAGETWKYEPTLLVPVLKASGGTARIESVQGEGETAQTRVVSEATVNINGKPDLMPDSAQYVLDYHSTIRAQTRFGSQTMWPLEHTATERGSTLFKIFMVDKQKRIGLVDYTPTDFQIQTRLISQPADLPPTP